MLLNLSELMSCHQLALLDEDHRNGGLPQV